ncbi:MAG: glycosyltransferase family 4 protein [Tepidisphaeraceae bacterium]
MTIAYLVNQYPQTSHSFIRREILAHESAGLNVVRYTLRRSEADLPDPQDRAERDRAKVVLGVGALGLVGATLRSAFTSPSRFFSALKLTIAEGRRSDRGLFRHLICLAEACVLAKWLKRDGVEHVHAHFGTNSTAVATLTHVLGSVPYSFTVHGPEEYDRAPGLGLRAKVSHAKFAVTISEFGRGQLMRWTDPRDWDKIVVVRCGLDDIFLGDLRPTPPPDVNRVVCVGRLVEQKAQLILVTAAALLVKRGVNIQVDLVGDGPMRPLIEAAIAKHKLQNHVTILGWKSASDVRLAYEQCRVVAQPSLAEGLPVSIMEALAVGRPVVTTAIAAIPELIETNVNGWIVPPGAAAPLADALEAALTSPTSRLEAMGLEGRRRVLERHSARKEAAVLLNYIQSKSITPAFELTPSVSLATP